MSPTSGTSKYGSLKLLAIEHRERCRERVNLERWLRGWLLPFFDGNVLDALSVGDVYDTPVPSCSVFIAVTSAS